MEPDVALALATKGYVVVPNFLSEAECAAIATEVDELRVRGAFRPASIGRGNANQLRPDIRSDHIHWLDETTLTSAQAVAWDRLDELRQNLNRELFLGLHWFEGHLAVYPEGARYAKHIDRFAQSTSPAAAARTVSYVLYLNRDWRDHHEGILRIYHRGDSESVAADILPEGGTLVCFLSAETPHEVLPPKRPRYSLTGWYRTDAAP